MARRGRSQFQFTVVELVVLAASFAATSCLVFLLGFYVGREVAGRHGPPRESVARIPEHIDAEDAGAAIPDEGAALAPGFAAQREPGAAGESAQPGVASGAAAQAESAATPSAAAADADPQAGGYTVQVLATRNRKEAESLGESLKAKGLGAFVAPVEDVNGKWYRVRIGRYDDPASAREMAERCRRELGLGQAYVSPL